ncbi:MAG: hypothetical protein COU81_02580 [Candidatus Portnoybacteria bacterium CG10_big_fil_rev_8_21_14_0_10_36_7]|uniref:Uncharacterized protein n=1 Tax=Candidatus Portnoybacteria bacterium CG10_big_fil_rev_8_21_14_0_10_36_7 TaxID=1974812 RepID=A0A2M8KDT7_9BACT|nr:MAG: hypothetical protein COU81_02580 [Candidatus Portnoybacteria bacterium CG10_big_fil_rev_8_21_14_0_10_36_7]
MGHCDMVLVKDSEGDGYFTYSTVGELKQICQNVIVRDTASRFTCPNRVFVRGSGVNPGWLSKTCLCWVDLDATAKENGFTCKKHDLGVEFVRES